MMSVSLDDLDKRCGVFTRRVAFVGVLGMMIISFATLLDILLRWLANSPIHGFNEVIEMGIAVAIAGTFPAGASQRVNLTIDLLGSRVGVKTTGWLRTIGSLCLLVFYVFLAWRIGIFALRLQQRGAETVYLELPMAPFIWAVSVFLGVAALVQVVAFLVSLKYTLAGARDPSVHSHGPKEDRPSISQGPVSLKKGVLPVTALILLLAAVMALFALYGGTQTLSGPAQANPGSMSLILFLLMWVLILLYVPLGVVMGLLGVFGAALLIGFGPALSVLGNETTQFITNAQVAVLPLFLIMGGFAVAAGMSGDIYNLAHALLGHRRGGLALATIGGCGGFGALTGSSIATTATIGQVALPEMGARGYSPGLSTGCVAAGGTLGALVPPSVPLIFYAILTEESIGQLFIASIVPAIIAIILYMFAIAFYVKVVPDAAPAKQPRAPLREILRSVRQAWGALVLFGVVIGGLYGGVFTATEAAAVGAGGAFIFALYRGKLSGKALLRVMGETTATTAMVYILIFGALTFSFFMGITGVPERMTEFLGTLDMPPLVVISLLLVIYIALGAVMDPYPVMFITVPIVAPLIESLGYSLVWWGVIQVVVLETGLITPPFGLNVFVLKSVAGTDVPLGTIFRGVMPFVGADLVKLALLVLFPVLALWLPSTMMP